MPLTDEEQKTFNRMIDVPRFEIEDKAYLLALAKQLYELTGNKNMNTRLSWIVEKL